MKVIIPEEREQFTSLSTNLPVNRYPQWVSTTAYPVGAKVTRNNYEYEAMAGSTGQDPANVTTTYWYNTGITNRFKPFAHIISDPAVSVGNIVYLIDPSRLFTAVAVIGVIGESVTVDLLLDDNSVILTRTIDLITSPNVLNWFDYFFTPVEGLTEALFADLPGYAGTRLRITINGSGDTAVGQIVIGNEFEIGTLNEDTSIGIQDFSRKERDEFGRLTLVERSYAQRAEYDIAIPTTAARQVQRKLASIRATPAVYYGGTDDAVYGTLIYGFFTDFSINLKAGSISFMTLTVEGFV